MSNYHILDMSEKGEKVRVAFHVPIPNENNAVGVNKRLALTQYKPFAESAYVGTLQAEKDQLIAGELYEHVETVEVTGTLSNQEKLTAVDGRYSALSTAIPYRLDKILKFWGKDAS